MRVAIAGAHGQIAQRLIKLLIARGDEVTGLVRNPAHVAEVEQLGTGAVVCDLEHAGIDAVSAALEGCDAAVFAAGAGPGSGADRKVTMDRDGAITLLEASVRAGVGRFVIVSSVGAENPPSDDEVFSVYLRAKAEADAAVKASDRAWTVVRPGRLTDEPGTGRVRIDVEPFRADVTRDDVAAVIAAVLAEPRSEGTVLYVNGGEQAIADALARAVS
ncbi:MAG TPA: NAD(P)H-binding protein [Solirubrobacteraceae bacterium]|nr:NAD(P)H-binding protein [Solirubrobacteraceae bacterium]